MSLEGAVSEGLQPGKPPGILVYVVDDQKTVGWVVEGILNLYNYRVSYFEDPRQALKAFHEANPKPQLMITDYVMPPMNGLELIQECKNVAPRLKTILYSGSITEDMVGQHTTRPDAFLAKPFQAHELIETVERALR